MSDNPSFIEDYLNLLELTDRLPSILKKMQEEIKRLDVTVTGISATLADMLLAE